MFVPENSRGLKRETRRCRVSTSSLIRSSRPLEPVVERKQVFQLYDLVPVQNYVCSQILFVRLIHELTASATRGKDVKLSLLVLPHRYDGLDPILAGGNHGA